MGRRLQGHTVRGRHRVGHDVRTTLESHRESSCVLGSCGLRRKSEGPGDYGGIRLLWIAIQAGDSSWVVKICR